MTTRYLLAVLVSMLGASACWDPSTYADEFLNGQTIEFPKSNSSNKISAYAEIDGKADVFAHYCAGAIYQKSDRTEEALVEFNSALAIEPDSSFVLLRVGMIQLSQKKFSEARKSLTKAVEVDPSLHHAYTLLASVYYTEGDVEAAIGQYEMAIKADPEKVSPYLALGELYIREKRERDAIQVYEDLVKLKPDVPLIWFKLGILYSKEGKMQEAVDIFRKAIVLKPDLIEARLGLAVTLELMKDRAGAIAEYEDILKINPLDINIYRRLARLYQEEGLGEESVRLHEVLIELDPQNENNYLALGYVYLKMENPAEAIETLKRAQARGLGSVELFYLLGVAHSYSAQEDRALAAFLNALALGGQGDLLHFRIGASLEQLGRIDEAAEHFRKAIELNPKNAEAYNYLGYMFVDRGIQLGEAIVMIQKALEIEPQNGAYVDSLGWAYFKQGRFSEALTEMERAVQYLGDDPTVREHLADVYWANSMHKEAIAAWELSLALNPDSKALTEKLEKARREIRK
jgi:putative PEP-CTERM system TPR-repeat lipoprotein